MDIHLGLNIKVKPKILKFESGAWEDPVLCHFERYWGVGDGVKTRHGQAIVWKPKCETRYLKFF